MISTPPRAQARPEVQELVARRVVPVGVEAQQGDLLRRLVRDRLLDAAANQVGRAVRVAGRVEVGAYLVDRRDRPVGGVRLGLVQEIRRPAPVVHDIGLGRRGHALEGVEQVERPHVVEREQGERRRHRASPAPNTAFDDRARHPGMREIHERAAERDDPLRARHREGPDSSPELDLLGREIGRKRLFRPGAVTSPAKEPTSRRTERARHATASSAHFHARKLAQPRPSGGCPETAPLSSRR